MHLRQDAWANHTLLPTTNDNHKYQHDSYDNDQYNHRHTMHDERALAISRQNIGTPGEMKAAIAGTVTRIGGVKSGCLAM